MFRATTFYASIIFVFACGATDEACTDSGTMQPETSSLLQAKMSMNSALHSDALDIAAAIRDVHQAATPYEKVYTGAVCKPLSDMIDQKMLSRSDIQRSKDWCDSTPGCSFFSWKHNTGWTILYNTCDLADMDNTVKGAWAYETWAKVVSQGVEYGRLTSSAEVIGSCSGHHGGEYVCEHKSNYIKWNINVGSADFNILSDFKVDKVEATAVSFVLWSGATMLHIGLDGRGNTFFYEGAHWGGTNTLGPTSLVVGPVHSINLLRKNGVLSVFIDNVSIGMNSLPLAMSIDAVGWRPWRNKVHVQTLRAVQA